MESRAKKRQSQRAKSTLKQMRIKFVRSLFKIFSKVECGDGKQSEEAAEPESEIHIEADANKVCEEFIQDFQINEINDFLLTTLRKDARSVKDQEGQGSCEVQGQMVEVSLHSQAISSSRY
ncbi:hypothetical protein KSP40_PGU022807 [Platanthera guangdongensis]|uniref:Uncharacterized protein n=1 Tax=Platanthera guangdongensis TaxID=2320717 RepID=A0ABR2MI52_9ASPA